MATAQTKFYEAASTPVQVGRGTVATHALTFAVDDTGTVDVLAMGSIINTGNSSETWSITPPSGVTVSPSSGTLIASGTQALDVTATAAGTYSLTLVCAGATITGNPQSFVASEPAVAPTTATLSGSTTATEGVAVTYTVTLNAAADQTYTITPSASDSGAVSPSTRTITAGNTTGTFTVTWAAAGAGRTVDFTISPSLTRAGRPITVTVNAAAEPSLATGDPEFTLLSASSGTIPFTVGQAVRKGNMPSASGIAITGATGQVKIKSTWDDGSAKIVIVSGTAALTADIPLTVTLESGTSSSGTALATSDLPSGIRTTGIEIDAGAFGSATWTGTDFDSPFETWVSGHAMSSWVYRKQVGSDAHLVARLEVRLYASGAVDVLPYIENGYLDVASPVSKSETYTFTLGGTDRFSEAIYLYPRQRTPLVTGSVLAYWLGTAHDVLVKHDAGYMAGTGLVPSYSVEIDPAHAEVTGLPATFDPLQQGAFDSALDGTGFRTGVCMLPHWDALHLATTATSTYKAVVFQGYSAGRYAFHIRDEATNRPVLINDAAFANTDAAAIATPAESPAQAWSHDHQPAVGYLAYLLTGRHYFMEETQFVASSNFILGSGLAARNYGDGLYSASFNVRAAAWGIRGLVYAATVTPDADTGSLRAAYMEHLTNNVDYFWGRYINQSHNPFGFVNGPVGSNKWGPYNLNLNAVSTGGTTTTVTFAAGAFQSANAGADSYIGQKITVGVSSAGDHTPTITAWNEAAGTLTFTVSPAMSGSPGSFTCELIPIAASDAAWMQDYMIATWGQMKSAELPFDGTTDARREAFWEWHAGQIVGRMGGAGADEYLYRDCSPYVIATAPVNQTTFQGPNWDTGAGPWFADWGEVYDATYVAADGATGLSYLLPLDAGGEKAEGAMRATGFDLGDPTPQETQFANSMRAIAYAVRHGVTGAEAAFHRVARSENYYKFIHGMQTAGFAQGALSPYVIPAWRRGQDVNEWRSIDGSAMSLLSPTNEAFTVSSSGAAIGGALDRMNAWCGLSLDTRRSEVWAAANGGHGDYYGNEVCTIDMLADFPAWSEALAGSSGDVIHDAAEIADGGDRRYAQYTDGMPTSRHSYSGQQFIETHSRAVSLGGSTAPRGTFFENVEAFDVDALSWDAYACATEAPPYGYAVGAGLNGVTFASAWSTCKDPRTGIIYVVTQDHLRAFTPDADGFGGSWSVLGSSPFSPYPGSYAGMAVDTSRNRLVWMMGSHPDKLYHCDLSTYTWSSGLSFPPSSAATAMVGTTALTGGATAPSSPGCVYVPELDAFLVRMGASGGTVYSVAGSDFAVTTLTTSGDAPPAAAAFSDQQGIFTRWLYVPALRGVVYFPKAQENAHFLRTT